MIALQILALFGCVTLAGGALAILLTLLAGIRD